MDLEVSNKVKESTKIYYALNETIFEEKGIENKQLNRYGYIIKLDLERKLRKISEIDKRRKRRKYISKRSK